MGCTSRLARVEEHFDLFKLAGSSIDEDLDWALATAAESCVIC